MFHESLRGKRCLVTGATRGIGLAVCRLLAASGARIALCGRQADHVHALATALSSEFGVETLPLPHDVRDEKSIAMQYQALFRAWKSLDVLVNNAGVLEDALLGMIESETVTRVLETNVAGTVFHMQGASRLMARGGSGSIVNISSIIGRVGNEGQVVYAASKGAVIAATYSAAKELAPKNIRVNAIAPGFIDTDMIRALPPDIHEKRLAQIAMKRIGTPSDVANVVAFLASEASSYVTGQVIGVDGGMLI